MYDLYEISFNCLGAHRNQPIQTISIDPTTGNRVVEWWILGSCSPSAATLYGAGTRVMLTPDDAGVTIYALIPHPIVL